MKVALLEKEVEHLKALLERERQASHDLARRLDDEAEERRRLTALLIHQPRPEPVHEPANQPERLTLAEKLFGKKS